MMLGLQSLPLSHDRVKMVTKVHSGLEPLRNTKIDESTKPKEKRRDGAYPIDIRDLYLIEFAKR